jgi:hypothetical protein
LERSVHEGHPVTFKRVVIEFVGGRMDGRKLDSLSANMVEKRIVQTCLSITNNAEVGRTLDGSALAEAARAEDAIPSAPSNAAVYTVVERCTTGDQMVVRMKHFNPLA